MALSVDYTTHPCGCGDILLLFRFSISPNGSLVIQNAQLDDGAHYRCSASNYLGRAGSSARVSVETDEPARAPVITTRPRTVVVVEGGIMEMTCVAEGSPQPDITWWNNNRLVATTGRVTVSNTGHHLRIQDLEVWDSGQYTCLAQNTVGRQSLTASLSVLSDGELLGHTRGHSQTTTERATTVPPDTMEATRGSTVQLQCGPRGSMVRPSVVWEREGATMVGGRRHRLGADGSLVIFNVSSADSGRYDCTLTDGRQTRTVRTAFSVLSDQPAVPVVEDSQDQEDTEDIEERDRSFSAHTGQPRLHVEDQSYFAQHLTGGENDDTEVETEHDTDLSYDNDRDLSYDTERDLSYDGDYHTEIELEHHTDLSYDVSGEFAGDQHVLRAIAEAQRTVDRALNHTVSVLFEVGQHTDRTPGELLNIFRYPSASERELARAGEIYIRTLELVEAKVREGGRYNLSSFSLAKLISPANLDLIGNLSGCEAVRRFADCDDLCFHSRYRAVDGSCNNHHHPLWGASLTPLRRVLQPRYENGFNSPIGLDQDRLYAGFRKPNSRLVSTRLISREEEEVDPEISHMVMQWGQFLDHDLDHSMEAVSRETFRTGQTCGATCSSEPPCFPILLPPGDPRAGGGEGQQCIEFTRSSPTCGSGKTSVFFSHLQQREQVNRLTAFIDGSQVYGSEVDLATNLRNLTNDLGRLREGITYDYGKPLLPFNDGHPIDCRRDPRDSDIGCFLAGDVRANEQLGLLGLHTLWFREHNRVVAELRRINPHWDGDRLYQEGRMIVGATMQHITFTQWLPAILGPGGMEKLGQYQGYRPDVDPSVSNVFATAAMRFGHTLVHPVLPRLDENLTSIPEGDLPLHKAFFSPWRLVEEGGLDPVLRGLYSRPSRLSSSGLARDLTERLFSVAHSVALDLAALNIQRGRDHGLAGYTAWLQWCGLASPPFTWTSLQVRVETSHWSRCSNTLKSKLEEHFV